MMSGLMQQGNVRTTRLRDFGAFQVDISTMDTHEYATVVLNGVSQPGEETLPVFLSLEQDVQELERSLVHSSVPQQSIFRRVSMPVGEIGETKFAIPSSPMVLWQWQQPGDIARGNISVLPEHLQRTSKKWISVAVRCGITFVLLALLFKSLSWADVFAALLQSDHALLLVGLTVGAFGLVISSYQWHVLMRGEHSPLDLARLINLYLVGVAFSHFLPTGMGGDAIKALYAGRETNNKEGAASAVLMSRMTGLIGMFLVALVVLIVYHQLFPVVIVQGFIVLSLLVSGMIVGTLFFVSLLPTFSWVNRVGIWNTLMKIGVTLQASMRKPRFLSLATAYGILFWFIGCLNYYVYAIALGIHVHLLFYFVAISLVSLLSFLPISLNGFGVREGAFVYIFASVHIANSVSVLLALLMDTQVLFFGILGALIYLSMHTMHSKKLKAQVRNAA